MAIIVADRVLETSTTVGTGAYTLAGAVTGYRAASTVCANGDTFTYYADDVDAYGRSLGAWETGLGTWGTGGILTRTTIYSSSNANAAVSWAAGTRRIALALVSNARLGPTTVVGDITASNLSGTNTGDQTNILGSAASTPLVSVDTSMLFGRSGLQYFNISGAGGDVATATNAPDGNWWHVIRGNHGNGAGYYTDLALPMTSAGNIRYRRISDGASSGWIIVLDSTNFSTYAAPVSHNHTSLTGVTSISFSTDATDSASITTTISGSNTYFDFNLTDDNNQEAWRWRFTPSGSAVYDAMKLEPVSNGIANLTISGSLSAVSKSFLIDHPTKPGMQLRYGSLEGPENGVYVRGRLKGNKIELPEYWTKLVDPDSITVNLTAIGKSQDIYVEDIIDNVVYIGGENVNCFYTVYAERVDIAKLEVEI